MSEFKAGDEVVRVKQSVDWAPLGYKTTVLKHNKFKDKDGNYRSGIFKDHWDMVKPKWTIYNNDKAWQDLSDKQKGKMLLAGHNGITISMSSGIFFKPAFSNGSAIYKAIKPETVKPEPTMEELFISDWKEFSTGLLSELAPQMIANGWNKPCK
jgi:hypothetical protein